MTLLALYLTLFAAAPEENIYERITAPEIVVTPGGRDTQHHRDVRRAFEKHRPVVVGCAGEHASGKPGKVVVGFVLSDDAVLHVTGKSPDDLGTVASCIALLVETWRFPGLEGTYDVRVTYTIPGF